MEPRSKTSLLESFRKKVSLYVEDEEEEQAETQLGVGGLGHSHVRGPVISQVGAGAVATEVVGRRGADFSSRRVVAARDNFIADGLRLGSASSFPGGLSSHYRSGFVEILTSRSLASPSPIASPGSGGTPNPGPVGIEPQGSPPTVKKGICCCPSLLPTCHLCKVPSILKKIKTFKRTNAVSSASTVLTDLYVEGLLALDDVVDGRRLLSSNQSLAPGVLKWKDEPSKLAKYIEVQKICMAEV